MSKDEISIDESSNRGGGSPSEVNKNDPSQELEKAGVEKP